MSEFHGKKLPLSVLL